MNGRPTIPHGMRQLQSIQRPWHRNVREYGRYIGPAFQYLYRNIGIAGLKDRITGILQQYSRCQANKRLVFDNQNDDLFQ